MTVVASAGPWVPAQSGPLALFVLVVVLLLLAPGFYFACVGASLLRTGLRARLADLDAVADAGDGTRVALEGTARSAGHAVEAPLTGRECLAYRADEVDLDGGDPEGGVPFLLECEDGTVLVRGDRGPVPEIGRSRRVDYENRLDAGETAFVAGVARSPSSVSGVAVPGDAAAVVGPPSTGTDGVGDRLRAATGLPFLVADATKAEFAAAKTRQGLLGTAVGPGWVLFVVVGFAWGSPAPICPSGRRLAYCGGWLSPGPVPPDLPGAAGAALAGTDPLPVLLVAAALVPALTVAANG